MLQTPTTTSNIVALDVGDKRVGLAVANTIARLPRPLTTIARDDEDFWTQLEQTIHEENPDLIVIGLPRNMSGEETAQSAAVRTFVRELSDRIAIPVTFQDETLSSVAAEAELAARGKPFAKGDIDALAASVILDDYLAGNN